MRRPRSQASSSPWYRAPLRIDLAGGTLDIWPLYLQLARAVTVNVAIDRYAWARLRPAGARVGTSSLVDRIVTALGGGEVSAETCVQCPRGSGLGGSSALAVALVRALLERGGAKPSRERILRLTRDLEAQDIRTPTGDQDYLAALHGGVNVIRFGPGGPVVEHPACDGAALVDRLVLFYTGLPHFSGINNWAVFRAVFDGNRKVRALLESIGGAAGELAAALQEGDLDAAARLVAAEWRYRRRLAPGITTPAIERAFALGVRHGALAGKVCGAGGGGCAFLFCRDGAAPGIAALLRAEGYDVLPARLAPRGLARAASGRRP